MVKFIYNHINDQKDDRDFVFTGHLFSATQLPERVDLSMHYPSVYDQGQIGSCTGNSISSVIKYTMNRLHAKNNFTSIPSRLFIYCNGRIVDEIPLQDDAGCSVRGALKGVAKNFVCDESIYKYTEDNVYKKPIDLAYSSAHKYKHFSYFSVPQDLTAVKKCLAQGFPVILGIQVYESFEYEETLSSGIIPMPDTDNESLLGGHCINLCGYDDHAKAFILRNSWGTSVGLPTKRGYFMIPYQYILNKNLASDLWKITLFSV